MMRLGLRETVIDEMEDSKYRDAPDIRPSLISYTGTGFTAGYRLWPAGYLDGYRTENSQKFGQVEDKIILI
jgi:hypothetical protein